MPSKPKWAANPNKAAKTLPRPDTRASRHERYGSGWYRLRRYKLALNPLCEPCQRHDRIKAARQVDHIKPVSEGGTNDLSNLQSICLDCHTRKTAHEARQRYNNR